MKKKVKDLNQYEVHEICRKMSCPECPFNILIPISNRDDIAYNFCMRGMIIYKNQIKELMEKEIEVEE